MKRTFAVIFLLQCAFITGGAKPLFSETSADINTRGVDMGKKDKLKDAIKEFDKAIKIRDKSSAIVYHNKAYALERMGKDKEAIKSYEEAWQRNNRQIVSGERLGYLYFKTKDWRNAVRVGEAVLLIDPKNKEVPKWLPLAYQRLKELLAKEAKEKEKKKAKKKKKKRTHEFFYATIDSMARFGYYNGPTKKWGGLYTKKSNSIKFIADKGLAYASPYKVFLKVSPLPFLSVEGTVENPFLGALSPDMVSQQEKLQAMFKIGPVILGMGALFTHYDDSGEMSFYIKRELMDYRLGIVLGLKTKNTEFLFSVYPRYLLREKSKRMGVGLDVVKFDLLYKYKVSENAYVYTVVRADEFFLFWHTWGLSNYWGVYDAGLGVSFHGLGTDEDSFVKVSIAVEWLERIYMRKFWERDPYTFYPNGQGWFGIDIAKYDKRNPFTGFWTVTQVIGVRFDEYFGDYFFSYQKVVVEIPGKSRDHTEINLLLGFGCRI